MIIGIDISKQSFDTATLVNEKVRHQQFDYTEAGIEAFMAQTPTDAHYVMEATGIYHARLALRLYASGRQVTVVNPLVIKRFAQMQLSRAKSDKADAALICRYGEQHALTPWAPASAEILELQQAQSWLDDLIRDRTRLINRQEACAHQPQTSPFVVQQMTTQRHHLDIQIKECERHLAVTVKKSFADVYTRLRRIPGIGPKTAIALIVVTHGFSRFDDIKALCAYIGVSPTTFRSGTSVHGKGTIAKLGQGRMRQLLYLCSWTAKRCNPACRNLYDRLTASGKPPKVINIAIAHKLLRQAFAVATKNMEYSETFA
jgi:transposase